MTHPIGEAIAAAAVVVAVGAGAVFVLPVESSPPVPTTAARVEALQRQVLRLTSEQRRLTAEVRAATTAARERKRP